MRRTRRRVRLLGLMVIGVAATATATETETDTAGEAEARKGGGSATDTAGAAQAGEDGDTEEELPLFEGDGVAFLEIADTINPGIADYVEDSIAEASRAGHAAVLIRLDTPGGLLEATRSIVQAILDAPLPVIVYVAPGGARAGSAGTFITLAGHVAAMAPGSNIGAAHPVGAQGEDPEGGGEHLARKIENDTVAFIESITERRGRNVEWARTAVLESVSVPSSKALELGVVDLVTASTESLLAEADGHKVEIRGKHYRLSTAGRMLHRIPMSTSQKFVSTFSHPNIFYLLMMLGVLGILAEVYHPGSIFPGVLGGICLILAFISMQALPINYGGLALILLSFAMFVGEVFVTSHGLLAIGGAVALTIGSILLIDTDDPALRISLPAVFSASGTLLAFSLFIVYKVVRAHKGKVTTGQEGLVGEQGEVKQAVPAGGEGKVLVHGEYWRARSAQTVNQGAPVRVTAVDGMLLTVEPLAAELERQTGPQTEPGTKG